MDAKEIEMEMLNPELLKLVEELAKQLDKTTDPNKKLEQVSTIISFLALYAGDNPVVAMGLIEISREMLLDTIRKLNI